MTSKQAGHVTSVFYDHGISASFHLRFHYSQTCFSSFLPLTKSTSTHPSIHLSVQPLSGVLRAPPSSPAPHFPWLPVLRPAVPATLSLLPPPRSDQSSNTPPGPPPSPHPGQNTNIRPTHFHFQPNRSQHHQSRALPPRSRQALNPSGSHPFRKCLHPLILLNCLNVRLFYLMPQHNLLRRTCPLLNYPHPVIAFHRASGLPTRLSFYLSSHPNPPHLVNLHPLTLL